jgi:diguanylate cyclase (GGDEF)-like protein/PAS domain S-box-containing protein
MFDKSDLGDGNESDIQDVLARMPVAVAWANARDGRILYVNRKFTTMFGYHLSDLSSVHAWIENCYVNPDQAKSVDEFWAHTRDALPGEPTEMDEVELDIRCKDGRIKTVLSGKIMLPNQSGALATFLDITPRKEKENLIRRQALEDPLTGLLNRRAFTERMQRRLGECREQGGGMALLLIDMDGFKNVNDSFGHLQGDVLLQKVAERLKQAVRDGDALCRIGGDEFGVVLHSVSNEGTASHVAERILYGLTRKPYELGQTALGIGASIGIALYPDDGGDEIALFKHADQALYRAKNSGRGRWCR